MPGTKIKVAAGAVCGAVLSAGVAYAAVPGAGADIKACYATTNGLLGIPHSKGDLRVVDTSESCRSYEESISWSQHGVPGPAGPTGARGATGETGATGPAGPATPPKSVLAQHDGIVDVSHFPTIEVLRVDLPAGTWALVAKGVSYNFGVSCELTDPEGDRIDSTATSFPVGDTGSFSLAGQAVISTPGTVALNCNGNATSHDSLVDLTSILAIAVASS